MVLAIDSHLRSIHFPISLKFVQVGPAGDSALQHPTVVGFASEIRVSPAQVVLRWALQRGPCRLYPSHPNPIASSRISIWNGVLGI
jgi:diketogulonate reductase-like aldo/keto reductase